MKRSVYKTMTAAGHTDKSGAPQVLLSALMWSLAGLLIRGTQCNIFWLIVIRNGCAGLVLLPSLLRAYHMPIKPVLCTGIWYSLFMIAFAVSTRVAGAGATVAGQYTAPLFLFLIYVWKGSTRVTPKNITSMLLIGGGCAIGLLKMSGGAGTILLPLSCGILFPAYSSSLKRCHEVSMPAVMAVSNLICAAMMLPVAVHTQLPSARDGLILGVAGILINGLAYVVYGKGIRKTSTLTSMILCLAEPILNPIWVWIFLQEKPSMSTVLSLSLILGGGILNMLPASKLQLKTQEAQNEKSEENV